MANRKSLTGTTLRERASSGIAKSTAAGHGLTVSVRRTCAVLAGKAVRGAVRQLGRGNGTAMPGRVTLALDSDALTALVAEIPRGTVLVTGSNGKGTTCRMLAQIMSSAGLHPLLNQEGSNQRSGLATAMVAHAGPTGHLPADAEAIGLFEVDEGSLPEILRLVRPGALVLTNIFRDQLDRYLEPAFVTAMLERAIRTLPATTTLVLNADDPRVACLAADLPNPRVYFGVEDAEVSRNQADPTSDFPRCPRCEGELSYHCVFMAHLGHWECPSCGLARPHPEVSATKIDLTASFGTRLNVVAPSTDTVLEIPLPGLYNAYNALAAVAAACASKLSGQSITGIEQVTGGHFRMEKVQVADHELGLVLAKNANGYTEVLRALTCDRQPARTLLGLNDCPGKQPDTSWIWDVDFDALTGLVPAPVVTGNRAADLAVRLKYARCLGDGQQPDLVVEPDPARALQLALAATPAGEPLWVISTSIVLVKLRRWLRKQGYVREIWQEQGRSAASAPPKTPQAQHAPAPATQLRSGASR
jgi:lipid II isoglutaminyl synthase (glutamine-hydrolysing)